MAVCHIHKSIVCEYPEALEAIKRLCTNMRLVKIKGEVYTYIVQGEEIPREPVDIYFELEFFDDIDLFVTKINVH